MDEFDPIDYYLTGVCADCDSPKCQNKMCDPLNWPDEEVIEQFRMELYSTPDDEELTLSVITEWYWDEI